MQDFALAGEFADLKLHDLSMHINLRSDRTTAFGSLKGASRIDIVSAAIRYKGAGIEAWLFGGESESTTIHVDGVDMKARMDMKEGHVTNAPGKQVNITRSITDVIINDEEMELT